MASSPNSTTTPVKGQTRKSDGELLQSLRGLSLSSSPTANTPPPGLFLNNSPHRPAVDRSPSVMSARTASRASSLNTASGRDSRSATPSLMRKASMNSLHAANHVAPPRRSISGNSMSPSTARRPPSPERPPPPTANGVARTYFRGELEQLHGDDESKQRAADTVVVLHDACYGHRYARPKTSRAGLNTIVERPERIKACVLGVAAAYVLLGERHCDGEYPPHPSLNATTIPTVPFRIHKSTRRMPLSSTAVTNVHGTKWMEELKIMCDAAEGKLAMGGKELQRPEMNRGTDSEPNKLHEGDLYLCQESLEAMEGSLGAVADAVDTVFTDGGPRRAFVAVRPPGHHCSASYPSGFCWVNNVHVGIMHAVLAHGLTHAAIIDFDLHHGDGSQAITWQHNSRGVGLAKNAAFWKKASIGYYSLHDINSYPCEMGDEEKVKNASLCIDNAHGQHVWNVHLEAWKTEAEFWQLYEGKYKVLLDKARKYLTAHTERLRASKQTSKAAIFLSAGFDASEWEGAGMQRHSVNVPTGFYARIAQDVTKIADEEGTSVHGRVISVLEGGYSDRALTSGVLSHVSGLAGSEPIPMGEDLNGLSEQMAGLMGDRRNSLEMKLRPHAFETSWWDPASLDMLEHGVVLSPPSTRAPRGFQPGNFSSPTTSSTAKMVEVARLRKQASMNGLHAPRPPTPPAPVVPWAVAAHALCSVLTPTERPTTSYRPDELTAEATRGRRERHLASMGITEEPVAPVEAPAPAPPPPSAPSRMSLRERKAPKSYLEMSEDEDSAKKRRRTVAGAAVLASEKGDPRSSTQQLNSRGQPRQPARRVSLASTVAEDFDGHSNNHANRALTSMSQRPETAMSAATTASASTGTTAPLAVKKGRTNATAKKDAPRAPKAKKATTGASVKEGSDVDNITSGVKKITLLTKQQKQARARENKMSHGDTTTASSAGSQTPSLPVTPGEELPRELVPPPPGKAVPVASVPPIEKETSEPEKEKVQNVMPTVDAPIVQEVNAKFETTTQPPIPEQNASSDVFIEYRPDGPTPETIPTQEPLQWLHVNNLETPINTHEQPTPAATSSPVQEDPCPIMSPSPMKRNEVPVFTPTSQLRFAPRTVEQKQKQQQQQQQQQPPSEAPTSPKTKVGPSRKFDKPIREVPESPDHLA
ncbi:unnamed protein product [Discula destructiva]